MRSLASLLLAALIASGAYYYFLKRAAPGPGTVATQVISTTGVRMDLMAIAQAERLYFAQKGSYGTLDQLVSSGVMTTNPAGRDGYAYSIKTAPGGFMVTARHRGVPAAPGNGVVPPRYPTLSVDQSMQVRQTE